jgi:aminopeptidase N
VRWQARRPSRCCALQVVACWVRSSGALGWTDRRDDDPQTLKLRGTLIELLARFDDAPTIEEALKRFDADESKRVPLAASIRSSVLEATGMHADRARFDQLMARLKAAGGEEDRWVYASALAGGRDEARSKELLAGRARRRDHVQHRDRASGNGQLAIAVWRALLRIYARALGRAREKSPGTPSGVDSGYLPNAAARFNEPARAAKLVEDQRSKAGPAGAAPASRIAARIALSAAVRQRDAAALQALLADW